MLKLLGKDWNVGEGVVGVLKETLSERASWKNIYQCSGNREDDVRPISPDVGKGVVVR